MPRGVTCPGELPETAVGTETVDTDKPAKREQIVSVMKDMR